METSEQTFTLADDQGYESFTLFVKLSTLINFDNISPVFKVTNAGRSPHFLDIIIAETKFRIFLPHQNRKVYPVLVFDNTNHRNKSDEDDGGRNITMWARCISRLTDVELNESSGALHLKPDDIVYLIEFFAFISNHLHKVIKREVN